MSTLLDYNQFEAVLQSRLEDRKQDELYRSLSISNSLIDFCSNDYLGLAEISSKKTEQQVSAKHGSTGSRLISGNTIEAENAEHYLAEFHGTEAALIFNCGYMANIGLLSCLAQKGDTYIVDELVHASIIDGIRLSHANHFKFKHNQLDSLEKKLRLAKGQIFVVVESLYSMDGDIAPLLEIVELCDKYKAQLIVDEAHALGIWGDDGKGFISQYELQNKVLAGIYTFGKALGRHGAAITGSATLKNYLINFARPFIYSTAMPPVAYSEIEQAYHLIPDAHRDHLKAMIAYFNVKASEYNKLKFIPSTSQIQSLIIGNKQKTKALAKHLLAKGIHAKAILSPTIKEGTERIRICLHSYNTAGEINLLLSEINTFLA